jgi:hypothetical protein
VLSSKSKFIASQSLEKFFRTHCVVSWLVFTEPGRAEGESLWSKDEAEKHFKPFRDWMERQGYDFLVVWELQKRGSWHPNVLVDHYIDVNWCRPWMVSRGWGQQMRFTVVMDTRRGNQWKYKPQMDNLVRYLSKYLTKPAPSAVGEPVHKKLFCGRASCRAGTTNFKWVSTEKPGAFLYYWGRQLWVELYGESPSWRDIAAVIRLGVEATGWSNIDFLWEFSVPGG